MKTETDYPFEFKIVPVNNGKLSELVRIDEKTFILTIPAEVGINHVLQIVPNDTVKTQHIEETLDDNIDHQRVW